VVDDLFDIPASDQGDAIVLRVVAHPGAGRTAVMGQHGDALKLKVAAPPVGGRANEACVELVAELFGVKAEQVVLTSGETSRAKRFRVEGVSADDARRAIGRALEQAGQLPGAPANRQRARTDRGRRLR